MAGDEIRPIIKLKSTAGTGYTYVTRKNRRNDPDRIVLRKFDPRARRLPRGTLMAKKSKIGKNVQRAEAQLALRRLPRDSSATPIRNRDAVDGRPRGNVGKVGLSRIRRRQMAHNGELPGITKSSW